MSKHHDVKYSIRVSYATTKSISIKKDIKFKEWHLINYKKLSVWNAS